MAGDWKALYAAACEGDTDAVALALAEGIDPNHQHPEFGTTPLIGAAENNQLEAVMLLLKGGADPLVRSAWDGVCAADVARSRGFVAVLDALEKRAAGGSTLGPAQEGLSTRESVSRK